MRAASRAHVSASQRSCSASARALAPPSPRVVAEKYSERYSADVCAAVSSSESGTASAVTGVVVGGAESAGDAFARWRRHGTAASRRAITECDTAASVGVLRCTAVTFGACSVASASQAVTRAFMTRGAGDMVARGVRARATGAVASPGVGARFRDGWRRPLAGRLCDGRFCASAFTRAGLGVGMRPRSGENAEIGAIAIVNVQGSCGRQALEGDTGLMKR